MIVYVTDTINITLALVSALLCVIVMVIAMQLRRHDRRMGWFLITVCICIAALAYQIAGNRFGKGDANIYTIFSYILYSAVAPMFGLYFIETELEEGQKWDGHFWTILHSAMAVLVIAAVIFSGTYFQIYMPMVVQYVIVLVMLIISSKSIEASSGFIIGICFPIASALIGAAGIGINVLGFGLAMLLLLVFFLYQSDTDRELMARQVEVSQNKVSLLMEQIHPHFIYNALQQIALLCDEKPEGVKGAILSFSGYLRNNLEALTNETMIPFTKEMEHTDTFIELAEVLPSKNFEVVKDFQIENFYIPALTTQPLVENAIKYGIGMSEKGDKIYIRTYVEGGYVYISVEDDGHGEKTILPTQKDHISVGTKNVRSRLKILCDGELNIESLESGTKAVIKIPKEKTEKK